MRRFIAIFLLTMLPLQFSWAAVASYCTHEQPASAAHFGHHEHQHRAGASSDTHAVVDGLDTATGVDGAKAIGALDLDCGHCHGCCGMTGSLALTLLGGPSAAPPRATLNEAAVAHAQARPERPQWLPLA